MKQPPKRAAAMHRPRMMLCLFCLLLPGTQAFGEQRWILKSSFLKYKQNPSYCVSLREGKVANGVDVILWHCSPDAEHKFKVNGNYIQYEADPSYCLAVREGKIGDGSDIILWKCSETPEFHWEMDGEFIKYKANPRYAMVVRNDNPMDGADIILWTVGGMNDKWSFDGKLIRMETDRNKCLSVRLPAGEGSKVSADKCGNGGTAVRWSRIGSLIRYEPNPKYCLSVRQGHIMDGEDVILWSCAESAEYQWEVSGSFIKHKENQDYCLSVRETSGYKAAADAVIWSCQALEPLGLPVSADQRQQTMADENVWKIDGPYIKSSLDTKYCASVRQGEITDGSDIIMWHCGEGQDSALKLEGDGYHWEVPQEPAPIGGALAPQRLDLAVPLTDFGAGEVQPSVISTQKLFLAGTGLNDSAPSPTQATASDAAARGLPRPPRQGQAPGRWAASQAWNDLSWPAQEPSASSTTCASVTPFFPGAAPELPQPYPSLPMNVPTPAPALRPPQPLPMQQQLLDLQHSRPLGQPLAKPSDPRFVAAQAPYRQDVATDRAEELIRLQQEVQTRLLQEQQRQQQLLDAMSHPAATHHPSAQFHLQGLPLPQEQFQQPLLQPQEHLGLQYFNRPPGENQIAPMQPSGADDEAGSVPQELNPGKITPDAGLHLDLLMRETSAVTAMQMRASRLDRPRKSASAFVTSPATIRQNDEETIHQSKFDVGSLYQGHLEALQNDRNCMLVHFANGRILFSNACCDRLFSPLTPLRHREVTEIIAEEDRVNFSSRIMYLSIGKYSVMQREQFKIITAKGVVPANIFGEHLMGSVWWMDCELVEDEDYQSAT